MPAKQPPTWTNDKRKLGDLKKWPDNPRYSTKDDAAAIVESYEDFGQTHLLLISPDNELYDGHQRLDSWLAKYGADFVVDVRVSSYRLSDRQRRKLVADLHIKATGQWNWDILAGWGDDLKDWGFDKNTLKEWNNDANNLKEMLAASEGEGAGNDAEPQTDKAAELQEKWQTATGQLWAIGEHRLLCGDSTRREDVERVIGGEKALVFTDAPYGVDVVKNNKVGADFGVSKKGIYLPIVGDETTNTAEKFYKLCVELGLDKFILWGGNYFTKFLPFSTGWIIWDKRGDSGIKNTFADGEMAWTNVTPQVRIYTQLWNGMIREGERDKRVHPTQKPVRVTSDIMSDFPADVYFDGFAGSGTTLVACQNLGRKCRAIEISPAYTAVILQRMQDAFPALDIHLIE